MKKLFRVFAPLAILCALAAPAAAQDSLVCYVNGLLKPCPGNAALKGGSTIQAASIPSLDAAKIATGDINLARIASSLAAGGGPVKGTVVTATTRTETPTIGTGSGTQHALPGGTGAILTADSLPLSVASGGSGITTSKGNGYYEVFVNPPATGSTGLAGSLAANNASNNFPSVTNPSECRVPQAAFAVGWDGGNLNLSGTDCDGDAASTSIIANPGGVGVAFLAFKTLSSITKSAVGAAAATATVGPGPYIGLATKKRLVQTQNCVTTVNGSALDGTAAVFSGVGASPVVATATAYNGARTYQLVCGLQ